MTKALFSILAVGFSLTLLTVIVKKVKKIKRNPQNIILSPDVLVETFIHTPVQSLLKCRSVCKSWLILIDDPLFIKNHLKYNSPRNQQLICSLSDENRNHIVFLTVEGPPVTVIDIYRNPDPNRIRTHHCTEEIGFHTFAKSMKIAGSFNGIVCLSNLGKLSRDYVALWNPTLMKWKPVVLPETKIWSGMSLGMGFDDVSGDFKIICIVPLEQSNPGSSRIDVYSVNANSWDAGQDRIISFVPNGLQCNFIVSGTPYWVGHDDLEGFEVLARIDPCTGLCRKFNYPDRAENYMVYMMNMRDSVAALIPSSVQDNVFELYVLDDQNETWTLLNNIGPLENVMHVPQCLGTGEIVLETWSHLFDDATYFLDPKTGRVIRNKEIEDLAPSWYRSYSHIESLVSFDGMLQIRKDH